MALATKEQIETAVLNIWIENPGEYDDLYTLLGGVEGITASVWGTFSAFGSLGWNSIKALVQAAMVVPPWMAGKLVNFLDDLFDEIKDIVSGAQDVTAAVVKAGTKIISKRKKALGKVHGRRMTLISKTRS